MERFMRRVLAGLCLAGLILATLVGAQAPASAKPAYPTLVNLTRSRSSVSPGAVVTLGATFTSHGRGPGPHLRFAGNAGRQWEVKHYTAPHCGQWLGVHHGQADLEQSVHVVHRRVGHCPHGNRGHQRHCVGLREYHDGERQSGHCQRRGNGDVDRYCPGQRAGLARRDGDPSRRRCLRGRSEGRPSRARGVHRSASDRHYVHDVHGAVTAQPRIIRWGHRRRGLSLVYIVFGDDQVGRRCRHDPGIRAKYGS